jgi:hypothetical protein
MMGHCEASGAGRSNRVPHTHEFAGRWLLAQLTQCARMNERKLDRIIGAQERQGFVRVSKRVVAEMGDL